MTHTKCATWPFKKLEIKFDLHRSIQSSVAALLVLQNLLATAIIRFSRVSALGR